MINPHKFNFTSEIFIKQFLTFLSQKFENRKIDIRIFNQIIQKPKNGIRIFNQIIRNQQIE